jgi:hypothetical protein
MLVLDCIAVSVSVAMWQCNWTPYFYMFDVLYVDVYDVCWLIHKYTKTKMLILCVLCIMHMFACG